MEAKACFTDDLILASCASDDDCSIEMLESESDRNSLLVVTLSDSADTEVVVVKPVGPDMPLSLLDDAEIPEGSGMYRLETGGVSPVDALE